MGHESETWSQLLYYGWDDTELSSSASARMPNHSDDVAVLDPIVNFREAPLVIFVIPAELVLSSQSTNNIVLQP